jgi:electron transfer flavoprotein alpha subunit
MSGIWVWVEQHNGTAASVSWEAIGLARKLADEMGEGVTAVVMGQGAGDLGQEAISYGADSALVCDDATLSDFRVDPYASLLSKLASDQGPKVILAGATTRGRDVMGAAAVDLETGLISDATGAELKDGVIHAIRPVYAGKLTSTVIAPDANPVVLTIRNRAFPVPEADSSRSGEVTAVDPAKSEDEIDTKVLGFESAEGTVSLADASIIVSGGRGVGGPEGYEPLKELVEVLDAALGASRASVDAGWIPYEHQVGQTGKTVSPDLYIACGISGAIQHQAGMRTSKIIVAVNKDADAPIFKLAHYGIVADLFDIVPALTTAFKDRLNK